MHEAWENTFLMNISIYPLSVPSALADFHVSHMKAKELYLNCLIHIEKFIERAHKFSSVLIFVVEWSWVNPQLSSAHFPGVCSTGVMSFQFCRFFSYLYHARSQADFSPLQVITSLF